MHLSFWEYFFFLSKTWIFPLMWSHPFPKVTLLINLNLHNMWILAFLGDRFLKRYLKDFSVYKLYSHLNIRRHPLLCCGPTLPIEIIIWTNLNLSNPRIFRTSDIFWLIGFFYIFLCNNLTPPPLWSHPTPAVHTLNKSDFF